MPQQYEAAFEEEAAVGLYKALGTVGKLPHSNIRVAQSYGMGRGSTEMGDFQISVGMDVIKGKDIFECVETFRANFARQLPQFASKTFDSWISVLIDTDSKLQTPLALVALKSGFTMYLNQPEVKCVVKQPRTDYLHLVSFYNHLKEEDADESDEEGDEEGDEGEQNEEDDLRPDVERENLALPIRLAPMSD